MNCPKCSAIQLRKKDGFSSPFSCDNCGGVWVDPDKLPNFWDNFQSAPEVAKENGKENDGKTGICPAGHGIMIRAKIDLDPPFFLEKCSSCGGIWFDSGELLRILQSDLTEVISEFWCKSWQTKQRKLRERQSFLDLNKTLLGDDLYETLMKLSEVLKGHPEKGRAIALLQLEVLK